MAQRDAPRVGADGRSALRIAYVRPGPQPRAAEYVLEQLRRAFPEYPVDVIEVKDLIRSRRGVFALNGFLALGRYFPDIVRGRREAGDTYFRTPYLFHAIRSMVRRRVRPDTHVFSFQIQSLFDASVEGVPHFVYTDHTNLANLTYGEHGLESIYPPSWQRLERQIYHHATRVLVRSRHVARSLQEHYGVDPQKIGCVYAGSNVPVLRAASLAARAASKDILFVGMDWERKGGPDLLAAYRRVRDRHPDATLTVAGVTPRIADPGVRVLGRVGADELDRLYAGAAVFSLPTLREPFGIVFVEAMERGLPIVATDVGALPDMVQDGVNGYLVAPGDVDALADRLTRLLDAPDERLRFGAASRRAAEQRYNWDAVGTAISEEVRRALPRA